MLPVAYYFFSWVVNTRMSSLLYKYQLLYIIVIKMSNIEQYIILMFSLLFQFFYTYDTSHKNMQKKKSRTLAHLKKLIYSFQKQKGRGGLGMPCPFLLVPPLLHVGALSVNWVLTGLQRLSLGPHTWSVSSPSPVVTNEQPLGQICLQLCFVQTVQLLSFLKF